MTEQHPHEGPHSHHHEHGDVKHTHPHTDHDHEHVEHEHTHTHPDGTEHTSFSSAPSRARRGPPAPPPLGPVSHRQVDAQTLGQ